MAVTKRSFLREAWSLAWPYWASEEKWSAGGLLAGVVALNLTAVWLTVRLNLWNKDFYNALQEYDWPGFWHQFGIFGLIAVAWIIVAVYQLYLRQLLQIRWRRWLTGKYLSGRLEGQAYYRMLLDQWSSGSRDQPTAVDL